MGELVGKGLLVRSTTESGWPARGNVSSPHNRLDLRANLGQECAYAMKKFVPGIGQSDFRLLREAGYDFVDKTFFIGDVLSDSTKVLLFPRPR